MAAALQKLESDYNQMRQEILTGVPLEQLRPLCVDLTEGSCIPSQVRTAAVIQVQVPPHPPTPRGVFSVTHSFLPIFRYTPTFRKTFSPGK